MSSKQGHECYMDNIKVKISERFKPPPHINVAVPYAQRLAITQQIQENMPNYEFHLERTVLDKMREWKSYRRSVSEDRRSRLEKARDQMKKDLENTEDQLEEVELKTVTETGTTAYSDNNFISMPSSNPISTSINQSYLSYSTDNNILVPTQAMNHYSNILTPIPLQTLGNQPYTCKQNDKSPFNISDFENDTSSPFDNMELKSINDMEELAQVLNKGKSFGTNTPVYSNYQHQPVQASSSQIQPTYSSYFNNQYSYNIPNSISYIQPTTSDYSQMNGCYYPQQGQPLQSPYFFSKPSTVDHVHTTPIQSPPSKSSCKSVPDIVRALENELEQTHLGTSAPKDSFIANNQGSRPKSTDPVYPRPKIKGDQLDNPFNLLTKNQQDVCKAISSMGFPLSRVARACRIFLDDQKKIVEHLLALTDLLDLGFSENDVSSVLIQCDNDRDKALDKLIS
ncbi:unnamed protein product [Phaedon cochleariae]|uniref:Ubiquitin-associated protein 1 n=1 Tax=Phaedon cochleariae TaxID=80249 RepID=A0A9P0GQG7_PHACE|nr:unnamed protein product [Phaedon cochleariae]